MTDLELLKEAESASEYSYSPYSHFKVGAAILTKNGKVYSGCNIENASFGATVCAERVALFKAVSEGNCEFEKIAVYSPDSDNCSPCGICRQALAEFSADMQVIYRACARGVVSLPLNELLKDSFMLS